jgi:hypothetical protein
VRQAGAENLSEALAILPERLGDLPARGTCVAIGKVLHAVRRKPTGLIRKGSDGNLERHRARQREIRAFIQGKLRASDSERMFRSHDPHQRINFSVQFCGLTDPID